MAYFVSLWVAQSLSLLLYTTKRAIIPLNDIIVHGRRHWRMCPLVQNSGGISAPQKSERKKEKNQKEKEKIRNQKPRNQKPKSLDLSIFPNQSGQNLRRNQNLVVGGFDSPESAPPPSPVKTLWRHPSLTVTQVQFTKFSFQDMTQNPTAGIADVTSQQSGIPLVGCFRILHHILEPELGETGLWSGLWQTALPEKLRFPLSLQASFAYFPQSSVLHHRWN